MDFILASSSKSRLELLKQINCTPKLIISPDIDESVKKKEKVFEYVQRIVKEKAEKILIEYKNENILSADTIVVCKNIIIQKLNTKKEAEHFFKLYSGKNVKVLTAICFISKIGKISKKLIETKIKFKHLNQKDLDDLLFYAYTPYCSGGFSIESFSESVIKSINGSYSNIKGLPLYETRNILISNNIL